MYCASSQVPLVKGPCKFQLSLRRASAVRIDAAEARRRHQRVRIAMYVGQANCCFCACLCLGLAMPRSQTQPRHKFMNNDKDCMYDARELRTGQGYSRSRGAIETGGHGNLSNAIDISLFRQSGPGVARLPSNSRLRRFAKGETREAREEWKMKMKMKKKARHFESSLRDKGHSFGSCLFRGNFKFD